MTNLLDFEPAEPTWQWINSFELDTGQGESIDKRAISLIISAKSKLSLGVKWIDDLAEELQKAI